MTRPAQQATPQPAQQRAPTSAARNAAQGPGAQQAGPVSAEVTRNAAFIGAHLRDPATIAAKLAELLRAHRTFRPTGRLTDELARQGLLMNLGAGSRAAANTGSSLLLGDEAVSDLTQGTSRRLSTTHTTVTPTFGGAQVTSTTGLEQYDTAGGGFELLLGFLKAIPAGTRPAVVSAYEAAQHKSLSAALGESVRDTEKRETLLRLLPAPFSDAQLTLDGFLEQLAVGLSYSDQTAEELNGAATEERRGSHPGALLSHFGYRAGELVLGRWGFQMRVFHPLPGRAKWPHPVAAFRGTEGVKYDPSGEGSATEARAKGKNVGQARHEGMEGTQDTLIGDFAPAEVGWLQYRPNAELIRTNLAAALKGGRVYATGHSLGGALAQIATALQPQYVAQVVTFQAANIDRATVQKLAAYNAGPGKAAPIAARHYRVDGDVVPTAGEAALPGQIAYFDRVSRPQGTQTRFGNTTAENASAGHVTPALTTYLRGGAAGQNADLKFLAENGLRDEATRPLKGAREVRSVFGGSYPVARDPRHVLEGQRDLAARAIRTLPAGLFDKGAKGSDNAYAEVFYQNIVLNTLMARVEALARDQGRFRDFRSFQAAATAVIEQSGRLSLQPSDLEMAKTLGLDTFENDYSAPVFGGTMGVPVVSKKYTPFGEYKASGVPISPGVRDTMRARLPTVWKSWRPE
ncbi:lipase family protein [Deinococcus gobiensis]|uniref:Lipase family n=1 Tax=Deinococcus gobiensis (strain DSM 21396 / JCM 16679 / CGMCC 1.7299 / I-0) TaxID=745776 RepID=H8GWG9_DEIGI|nr:lipase family protein [Deinococcus gobiensis]AFD25719.1 Lipase family [Deinococcus gobiensis I-0]